MSAAVEVSAHHVERRDSSLIHSPRTTPAKVGCTCAAAGGRRVRSSGGRRSGCSSVLGLRGLGSGGGGVGAVLDRVLCQAQVRLLEGWRGAGTARAAAARS